MIASVAAPTRWLPQGAGYALAVGAAYLILFYVVYLSASSRLLEPTDDATMLDSTDVAAEVRENGVTGSVSLVA